MGLAPVDNNYVRPQLPAPDRVPLGVEPDYVFERGVEALPPGMHEVVLHLNDRDLERFRANFEEALRYEQIEREENRPVARVARYLGDLFRRIFNRPQ